jgi:hypothetical protein
MKGYRLSIDPGVSGTGVSCWSEKDWEKRVNPVWVRNVYATSKASKAGWVAKTYSVLSQLDELLNEATPVVRVYSEFPLVFGGVIGNAASASKGSEPGDVLKLAFMVGSIAELCRIYEIPFDYYTPTQWLGQLNKEIVQKRIRDRLPTIETLKPVSHGWDSVGLGLFAKGFF